LVEKEGTTDNIPEKTEKEGADDSYWNERNGTIYRFWETGKE